MGSVRTIGGDGNTIVKMHLVNSYLHPNANNWPNNWVWGSHTLNHRHSGVEELAKLQHPETNEENISLNYETIAAPNRPTALTNADGLGTLILNRLAHRVDGVPNMIIPSLDEFVADVRIRGETINNFVANWATGVGNSATTAVTVNYRAATAGAGWGATTTVRKETAGDQYSLSFDSDWVAEFLGGLWIDTTSGRPRRTRA